MKAFPFLGLICFLFLTACGSQAGHYTGNNNTNNNTTNDPVTNGAPPSDEAELIITGQIVLPTQ